MKANQGKANNKDLNLSAALYGRYVAGSDVEPFQIWDAGAPQPTAVATRERQEIKSHRILHGKLMSNIRPGGDGQKESWRYVYGWREIHSSIVFYVGSATNWIDRTKQEWADAISYIPTREKKSTAKARLIDIAESMGPLLYCLVSENRLPKWLCGWLSLSPDGLSETYRKRRTCIKKLPCGIWLWFDCSEATVVKFTRDVYESLDAFWPGWWKDEWWHIRAKGMAADSLELRNACFEAAAAARARKSGKAARAAAGR